MYSHLWGLRENPFSLATDPAFLYRSTQHEEALAKLIYGVQNRSGFIQLTGEVGTGKTMMLECLRDFLKKQFIEFAFLSNPRIKVDQFFATLARSFDLGCDGTSKTDVTFALNELLLQRSEEHTSELQSRFGISYAVFCLKKKKQKISSLTSLRGSDSRLLRIACARL